MKRVYISVAVTCLVILAIAFNWFRVLNLTGARDHLAGIDVFADVGCV